MEVFPRWPNAGSVFRVEVTNSARSSSSSVDPDGNPIVINATGPGEEEAQALLSSLGLGSAILIPIARSNLHSVLFAARDASGPSLPRGRPGDVLRPGASGGGCDGECAAV